MAIAVGDQIPEVKLAVMAADGPTTVNSREVLGVGKTVLFAVPGAFTPTCSDYHLPGFVVRADDLKAKGIDTIACISVNDAFVMDAWGKSQNVGPSVLLLADGNGDFAEAVGLVLDGTGFGMGVRSQRYAMVLEDGIVRHIAVESGPGLEVSSADAVLQAL
jgi:peroxiredoxin